MSTSAQHRILIADDNPLFREALAERFRAEGHDVVTAATGEQAFLILRDWGRPVDWLYSRATLPGLVDGWILADEYRMTRPDRPAVVAVADPRAQMPGHLLLLQPSPVAVSSAMRHLIEISDGSQDALTDPHEHRRVA